MTGVVEMLRLLPPSVVLVVAVVLVAGETGLIVGLLFPVEITLLTVGFLAYVGEVPLLPALLLMFAAAMAGDAAALRGGRKYGPRVRGSRLGVRVGERRWNRADQMLHRLGGRSAFVARWVPFVRTLLPRLAGSAGMSYRTFLPWNVAGVVSAVGFPVVVGYLAGASYVRVAEAMGRASTAVVLLLVAIVAILLVGRWLGRHPHPVQALLARAAALPPLRALARRYGTWFRELAARIGPAWALVLNLTAGLALLFGLGLALSWSVRRLVGHSGLSGVDAAAAVWFADHRTGPVTRAAEVIATGLGGTVVVAVVVVVALLLAWLSRAWRTDLAGMVGTAGAFVPLVVLAVVAGLSGGDAAARAPVAGGAFSTQGAVATAGLCMLAWLLTRRAGWPVAVAGWTAAVAAIVLLLSARLYLGWDTASATVTALLLGVLWPAVFMAAWVARDRVAGEPEPEPARVTGQEPISQKAQSPLP